MFIGEPHKSFKNFVISRIARLYITFWIAVTITTIVTLLIGGARFHVSLGQYLVNLTMLNEFVGVPSIDAAWWFMTLVLTFNFLVGILILIKLIKWQDYFAGIWLVLGSITYFYHVPIFSSLLLSNYVSFFVAGIIFQSAKTHGWNWYRYLVMLGSLTVSIHNAVSGARYSQNYFHQPFPVFIEAGLTCVLYVLFYLITIRKKPLNIPNIFILFGAATYPWYLLHQNIGYMVFNWLGQSWNKYLLLSITAIVIISISIVIAKYIEPYCYKKLKTTLETIASFIEKMMRKRFA